MRNLILMIGFLIVCSASLMAQESSIQEHAFDVGAEIYNFHYSEPDPDVEWNGIMYGLAGAYTYHKDPYNRDNLMIGIEARCAWGQVDYDGELSDGTSYTVDNIDDYTWELRGVAGKDFAFSDVTTITPYAGLAYRYLNDDLSSDPAGYGREANYLYSPIGIQTITDLQNSWTVGLKAEYDLFWYGVQKTHWSDLGVLDLSGLGFGIGELDDMENRQNNGYGLRASIEIQRIGETVDFIIEPFIRYWNIEKSEVEDLKQNGITIGEGWEPANNTTEAGIKFMARF